MDGFDSPESPPRRRRRNRLRTRNVRGKRFSWVEGVVGISAITLIAAIGLMVAAFYHLSDVTPMPGSLSTVLHLRDLVSGAVWLQNEGHRPLQAAQLRQIGVLLPAIRQNLQGPPTLVDEKLEQQMAAVFSPLQLSAIQSWALREHPGLDYMASLSTLEQLAGGRTHADER